MTTSTHQEWGRRNWYKVWQSIGGRPDTIGHCLQYKNSYLGDKTSVIIRPPFSYDEGLIKNRFPYLWPFWREPSVAGLHPTRLNPTDAKIFTKYNALPLTATVSPVLAARLTIYTKPNPANAWFIFFWHWDPCKKSGHYYYEYVPNLRTTHRVKTHTVQNASQGEIRKNSQQIQIWTLWHWFLTHDS